jgi:hypothetical protein
MTPFSRPIPRRLALAALSLAVLLPALAEAQQQGGNVPSRKTRAFEMCRDELARREGARDVRTERILRNDHENDRVYLDADMLVRSGERSYTRRMACVVDFRGDNRITRFEVSGGGGGDKATRLCWEAATAAGFRVRDAGEPRKLEDGGRIIPLDAGRGNELLCLYSRGVQGIYQRRR